MYNYDSYGNPKKPFKVRLSKETHQKLEEIAKEQTGDRTYNPTTKSDVARKGIEEYVGKLWKEPLIEEAKKIKKTRANRPLKKPKKAIAKSVVRSWKALRKKAA